MDHLKIAAAIAREVGVRTFSELPPHLLDRSSADPNTGSITAARPDNDLALATFAHEAGHLATSPKGRVVTSAKRVCLEYRASAWGMDAIRRHGGEVTDAMISDARYALSTYVSDLGQEAPCEDAYSFARGETSL